MVGHPHTIPLELVGSILEIADVAWSAVEHRRGGHKAEAAAAASKEGEVAQLRAENQRLRTALSENLAHLQNVYMSPDFAGDCPPDLYNRLIAAVEDSSYLTKLDALQEPEGVPDSGVPGTEMKDVDPNCKEVIVDVDGGESSWWVWLTNDDSLEEVSGIDNESYVVITEENVVDGVSNFIARCILENPKSRNMAPEELQKAMTRVLDVIKDKWKWKDVWEAGKILYSLSTWGIALAGLYRHRAIVKAAAKGVSTSAKIALKVL